VLLIKQASARADREMTPRNHPGCSISHWLVITLVLLSDMAVAAPQPPLQPPPRPYRLPRADLVELANLVCMSRHGVPEDRIAAWREPAQSRKDQPRSSPDAQPPPPSGAALHASVECKPHETTPQFARFFAAECERTAGWQCARSEVRLRAEIAAHSVTIRTNGYNAELAHDLVTRIFAYHTHKGGPAISPDTAQCSLAKGPEKDMLDVNCDGHIVRLSYWCPQSRCPRVFSIDNYFIPANAAGL
jgi:hypothetical protein